MNETWLNIRQPEEVLDYVITVDTRDEAIANVTHEVSSPDLVVENVTPSGKDVTFWVSGGIDGLIYSIKFLATTAAGRVFRHTVGVPVGAVMREPESLDMLHASFKLRQFMRDTSLRNHLLMNELEFTWGELEMAIDNAVAMWNGTPPLSDKVISQFDLKERRVLYMDAASYLFQMGAHHQSRNQINYQDQGFSVSENDKGGVYLQISDTLRSQADLERRRIKGAKNIDDGWGGVHHDTYDEAGGPSSLFGFPGE